MARAEFSWLATTKKSVFLIVQSSTVLVYECKYLCMMLVNCDVVSGSELKNLSGKLNGLCKAIFRCE